MISRALDYPASFHPEMSDRADESRDVDHPLTTVASGASLVFGGRLVKLALGFLTQVVMARLLGASLYGGVVLALMVMGIGSLLARVGLSSGVLRKLPYYEDEPENARGVVKASIQIGVVTGVLVGALLYLAAPVIATRIFRDPEITLILRIAAFGVPFSVLMEIAISTARGLRDARTHVLVKQLFSTTTGFILVTLLLLAGFGIVGAVVARVATVIISALVALVLAYRTLPFRLRGPTASKRIELLAFSLPLLLATGAEYLLAQTDTFLIGVFMASGSVGVYNVVYRLHSIGLIFFYPVTFLLPPVLTRLATAEQFSDAHETYQVATKWMALLTLPIFMLVFLFPATVLDISFGAEYVEGATALRILILPVFVTTVMGANGAALVALGHNRITMYVTGGIAILNILLNLALIPPFGIVGAAAATATAFLSRDALFATFLYSWYGIHPFSAALVKPLVGTLLLAPVGYLAFLAMFDVNVFTVVVVGLAFLAVYGPLVIRLDGIGRSDVAVFERFESSVGMEFTGLRRAVRYLSS